MSNTAITPPSEYSPVRAIVVSVLVLAVVAAAVFFLNPRKTADLKVTDVQLFAPHTTFAATGGTHVVGTGPQEEDDLYVVANVRLEDKLRLPLFPTGWTATLTTPEDTEAEATTIAPEDYARLTQSFPDLAPMLHHPLATNAKADAEQAIEGTVLLLFPNMTMADWKKKKSAALTLTLAHQNPQTVALP